MKILTKWRNFKNMRIKQKELATIKQMANNPSKNLEIGDDKNGRTSVNVTKNGNVAITPVDKPKILKD